MAATPWPTCENQVSKSIDIAGCFVWEPNVDRIFHPPSTFYRCSCIMLYMYIESILITYIFWNPLDGVGEWTVVSFWLVFRFLFLLLIGYLFGAFVIRDLMNLNEFGKSLNQSCKKESLSYSRSSQPRARYSTIYIGRFLLGMSLALAYGWNRH